MILESVTSQLNTRRRTVIGRCGDSLFVCLFVFFGSEGAVVPCHFIVSSLYYFCLAIPPIGVDFLFLLGFFPQLLRKLFCR